MKECGIKIINMEKDIKNLVMDPSIEVITSRVSLKVAADINGKTAKSMKDSGSMASSMALESGEEPKVILISENGDKERQMVMEFILGLMVIDMKENLSNASNMEKESSISQMEILIKAIIKMENHQGTENTIGFLVASLRVILKQD